MAVITQTIQAGDQRIEVTEMQKALISLGADIATAELFTANTAGTYGPSTRAAVTALLARFGISPQPNDTFNAISGRLLHVAVGAEAGNCNELKQAVRDAFQAREILPAATPSEMVWLARYALIARDFTTTRAIVALIPDEPVIKDKVAPIVYGTGLQPTAPELLNPENYYAVVYDYVSRTEVQELLAETS